jgi:hypothetical protein
LYDCEFHNHGISRLASHDNSRMFVVPILTQKYQTWSYGTISGMWPTVLDHILSSSRQASWLQHPVGKVSLVGVKVYYFDAHSSFAGTYMGCLDWAEVVVAGVEEQFLPSVFTMVGTLVLIELNWRRRFNFSCCR